MSCVCADICGDTHDGHVCGLESEHDGPHSCHSRVFRLAPRKGDIVWQDPSPTTWKPPTRSNLRMAHAAFLPPHAVAVPDEGTFLVIDGEVHGVSRKFIDAGPNSQGRTRWFVVTEGAEE